MLFATIIKKIPLATFIVLIFGSANVFGMCSQNVLDIQKQIKNHLERLPAPKEILLSIQELSTFLEIDEVVKILQKCLDETGKILHRFKDYNGTVLHYASKQNDIKSIMIILKLEEKNTWNILAEQDVAGYTALHEAASKGHFEVFKILCGAVGPRLFDLLAIKSKPGQSAFRFAVIHGHKEIVEYVLKTIGPGHDWFILNGEGYDDTAVHDAAYRGQTEIIEILLNYYNGNIADLVTRKNAHGRTALDLFKKYIEKNYSSVDVNSIDLERMNIDCLLIVKSNLDKKEKELQEAVNKYLSM